MNTTPPRRPLHLDPLERRALCFLFLCMPVILLASNIRLTPPLRSIDPWLYLGGFLDLPGVYSRYGQTYYVSRLPWMLYGKLLHAAMPVTVAHALTGFSVYFSYTVALYLIAARFYRREIALFVAALAATNPLGIFHAFWGHPDVPSTAIALCAVASLLYANSQRTRQLAALAGALVSLAVASHLFSVVVFAPAFLVNLLANFRKERRQTLTVALWTSGGFALGVGLLSTVGYFVYGRVGFWMAQIDTALWVVSGGWHNWADPLGEWVPEGPLTIPFGLGVVNLLVVVFGRQAVRQDPGARFLYPYVFSMLAIFLFTDFGMGGARLQHAWYYVFLVLPSLLLFAPLLQHAATADPAKHIRWMTNVYLLISLSAMMTIGTLGLSCRLQSSALFAAVAVLIFLFGIAPHSMQKLRISVITALAVSFFFAVIYGPGIQRFVFARGNQWIDLEQSITLYRAVHPHLPKERDVRFFYNNKEGTRNLFNSVNALYLWGYSMLSNELPMIAEKRLPRMMRASSVVILSKVYAEVEAGLQTLDQTYVLEGVRHREIVTSHGEQFYLLIADVSPRPPSDSGPDPPD